MLFGASMLIALLTFSLSMASAVTLLTIRKLLSHESYSAVLQKRDVWNGAILASSISFGITSAKFVGA
jgi:hypothetical protein